MGASDQNLRSAREIYDAFLAGDVPPLFGALAEDVVWNSHSHPRSPLYGVHDGIEGVQAYFGRVGEVEIERHVLEELVDAGDRAVALIDVRRRNGDGSITERQLVHVPRFTDGSISRVDVYEASAHL